MDAGAIKLSLRSLGDEDTTVHCTRTLVFLLPNPCCTIASTLHGQGKLQLGCCQRLQPQGLPCRRAWMRE